MSTTTDDVPAAAPPPTTKRPRWFRGVPLVIGAAVLAMLLLGETLFRRAGAHTNKIALDATPKPVTVVAAHATTYRPTRRYVGTLEPWISARIGPQVLSAYLATVLVRPGDAVKKGDVIATLDCRAADAANQAVSQQARALAAHHVALARQADRMSGLLDGGYVAPNELEQRQAESASEQARVLAARAQLAGSAVAVDDCVLRAPFDGEVGERTADPGAFVRPGSAVVTLVDRRVVRVTTDVPENDFKAVAPGTVVKMKLLATGVALAGKVARRSPAADPATRTVHVEIDVPNDDRALPVNTTAEIGVDVGEAVPAVEIPLIAADVRRGRARLYVVKDGIAHAQTLRTLGETLGSLFVEPRLADGATVVTEGRTLLQDGDRVDARDDVLEGQDALHRRGEGEGGK